jgi:hypothetical protein
MSVKDMVLAPAHELAPADPPTINLAVMFERLAVNPDVPVDKMERLIAMQERILARDAEQKFNAAMSAAQKGMRPVAADMDNQQTKSRYASYAAIDRALRPIYTAHGFGLSFDTGDGAPPDFVRMLCYVTHEAGHARTYHIDMPADGKGAKGGDVMSKTHAAGAAASYGMRYLLKMVFNVAVGEDDDDGNGAQSTAREIKVPHGFEDWWTDLDATADEGLDALTKAWKASTATFRDHVFHANRAAWEALKRKAGAVKPGGAK